MVSRVKTRWPYKATRASGVETEIQRNFTEKVTSTSRAGQIGKEQKHREQTKLGRGSNGEVDYREGGHQGERKSTLAHPGCVPCAER